jgi:iron(III) transport system substrate-binding protein
MSRYRTVSSAARVAGLVAALALAGCGGGEPDLVVYSGGEDAQVAALIDRYGERTGKEVEVRSGETSDLVDAVLAEGEQPRPDVFLAEDAGALGYLAAARRLAVYTGAGDRVPPAFRSPDDTWVGVSGRVSVLIVNTGELPRARWPRSLFDLTDPRWRGRIAAPGTGDASWIGFVSALRLKAGEQRARGWLDGLERNRLAQLDSQAGVRDAVGDGEYALGFVDHHHVEQERAEGSPVRAIHTDQEREGFGTPINATSAGIVAGAAHPEEARAFVDFLLEPETQRELAERNFEYPLVEGVEAEGLPPLEEIRGAGVSLQDLGAAYPATVALLDDLEPEE